MFANMEKVVKTIKAEKDIALISHVQPDGDAIGSILGLGLALIKKGHTVQMLNPDGVPQMFTFLPGCDLVRNNFLYVPDTVILVDCTDINRIGSLGKYAVQAATLINIDHHVSNSFFGKENLVDTNAAATGEIIYKLIKALEIELDSDIATSLYTAIVTDTGSFQFENTTSETHRIAADLLNHGTDLSLIRKHLWESVPLDSIRMLTCILKTLELDSTGRIAWITVPYSMFKLLGANKEHVEGIVNYAKSIQGVEIGIVFKELEPNIIRVGLRSKSFVDVNKVAQVFGGGGHKRASGCVIESSLEEAKKIVIQEAKKALNASTALGG